MSTSALPGQLDDRTSASDVMKHLESVLVRALTVLSSLKLTIVLFSLAMVIVFVGSLAQSRRDVWQVMAEYFRTYVAWIQIKDLFPPSMFPQLMNFDWNRLGPLQQIPFPGGWTIGWVMLANLTAAHALKFRVRARGLKLVAGLGVVLAGVLLTVAVVITGNAQTGVESGNAMLKPLHVWYLMLGILGFVSVISLGQSFLSRTVTRSARIVLGVIGVAVGALTAYYVIGGEAVRPNVSAMRILWQLLKGGGCSLVLLVGCNLLFDKRGGIVLLHVGVALLMFSELQVGIWGKENMLTLVEGETATFMRDIRDRELAVIHRDSDGKDEVVVVPQHILKRAADQEAPADQVIMLPNLPFDVAVRKFLQNSTLRGAQPDDQNRTATGLGSFAVPIELEPVTGMDESSDQSSAYIDIIERGTGKVLSSMLLSQNISELRSVPIAEQVNVGDTDYRFYLRFQRNYRPYEVKLIDVSRTNYVGSSTPRDYRSTIVISDPSTGGSDEFTLWMNNPLRFRGETFYQSGYNKLEDGSEATTLSVVRNTGWMLPYLGCMIVAFGMFSQFRHTLSRFLNRTDRTSDQQNAVQAGAVSATFPSSDADVRIPPTSGQFTISSESSRKLPEMLHRNQTPDPSGKRWVPAVVAVLTVAWLISAARTPKQDSKAMNLFSFAQIPVAWNGRPQPVDSFAQIQLLMLSHKSTFEGELDQPELDMKREKIVERFRKHWPSVDSSSLDTFSGSYPEWMAEMVRLTSSGEDAVEEHMRSLMVGRMPAVRWFLDTVARPEKTYRHRVIKIEDDQVLSQLGLPKRSGLAYSLMEIEKKLLELQPINRRVVDLQMKKQEASLTTHERRVGELFEKVSRIRSLHEMFLDQESGELVTSVVRAWSVLRDLGDRPAVMGVPTGNEDEQRSWETVVGANGVLALTEQLKSRKISSADELIEYVETKLPREIVSRSISGTIAILASNLNSEEPTEPSADGEAAKSNPPTVQELAARAAASGSEAMQRDVYLRRILMAIASSTPGATADDILATLSDAQVRDLASEKISSEVFAIFQRINQDDADDPRLSALRKQLQSVATEDEAALSMAMNRELLRLAYDDIQKRAGHLLPGGANADTFERNTKSVDAVLSAWSAGNPDAFNTSVAAYRSVLASDPPPHLNPRLLKVEAWFNYYEPFYKAICLYLPVMILSFIGWMGWQPVLRKTSIGLMLIAFIIHTAALGLRIWISGRAPVTNLYSSAIFIGWAIVGASFVVERITRKGIGNLLGASVGLFTLTIAHVLARDEGDTLGVLQAVLDTSFWLWTHVVCITLGYAATLLAGGLGIMYVFQTYADRSPQKAASLKEVGSLVYGTLCFALFFSLVGTVLGGLWADDSWGRFWGWDPKENGAMLIVLWNALILHARWDKMVREYGTAVLAMVGNVVTAWSWFGVNELKAGLHTYGFTEGRLLALAIFVGLQLTVVAGAVLLSQVTKRSTNAPPRAT